jgi:hypothetical protein
MKRLIAAFLCLFAVSCGSNSASVSTAPPVINPPVGQTEGTGLLGQPMGESQAIGIQSDN